MARVRLVTRLRRLLISPAYAALLATQALSTFAEYVLASAVTVWLATALFAGDALLPLLIGTVVVLNAAPRLVLAPFAGVWVDRTDRAKTMLGATIGRCVGIVCVFATVSASENRTTITTALLVGVLCVSVAGQFFDPARISLVQLIVPEARRVDAASMSLFVVSGGAVVATMSGPAVYSAVGGEASVALSAALYVLALLLLVTLRRATHGRSTPRPSTGAPRAFRTEFVDGIRLAWQSPALRVLLLGTALYGVCLGVNNSSLALFAIDIVGLSAGQYGVISGLFPAGTLLGLPVSRYFANRFGASRCYPWAVLILGSSYVWYSTVREFLVAALVMFMVGVAFSLYSINQGPIIQLAAPPAMVGRVYSLTAPVLSTTSLAATAACAQLMSWLQTSHGRTPPPYDTAIAIAGIGMAAGGSVVLLARRRQPKCDESQRT